MAIHIQILLREYINYLFSQIEGHTNTHISDRFQGIFALENQQGHYLNN